MNRRMTLEEAIEILEEVKELDDTLYAYSDAYMKALEVALYALKEIRNYRKLGTLEELARAKRYIDLSKRHSTIGEMIDECAAYEQIGTVEDFRETVDKQKPKKPKDELKINPVIDENGAYVDADMTVYLLCPNCGEMIGIDESCDKFCRECGQAIDENLEGMDNGT